MTTMRLAKYLAACGVASRRKAEAIILQGEVAVNGEVVTAVATNVSLKDQVTYRGVNLHRENKEYYLLNKPGQTVSTSSDEHGRATVIDLFPKTSRLFSVGRLDYHTTGVLVVTNDGEFAHLLMHPVFHIPKVYDVIINGILNNEHIKKINQGIVSLDGVKYQKAKVEVIHRDPASRQSRLYLTIHEGKNHQVKKMMEALGFRVNKLDRRKYGFLDVFDLKRGEYRRLKPYEVKRLKLWASKGIEK